MKRGNKFLSFEHKSKNLQPYPEFLVRMSLYFLIALLLIFVSAMIGSLGYHFFARLSWIDAFYNACMILTGMGPVSEMQTGIAKIFSSFFALYSGIAFLSTIVIFLAPIIHRLMHIFHLGEQDD
jgi:hypothetical protein